MEKLEIQMSKLMKVACKTLAAKAAHGIMTRNSWLQQKLLVLSLFNGDLDGAFGLPGANCWPELFKLQDTMLSTSNDVLEKAKIGTRHAVG
ncbi:hypothetical protein Nepgr_011039 [Nepenthes gracilis]|uniref:Uncharacterized protein n=1 Tax=Nepenthes gracilis TaxID=150966 RepID=A0AAD3SEI6_NEPGR|nr:hypothetical protein Nepgr_011039 [Nepenthes gracilis]